MTENLLLGHVLSSSQHSLWTLQSPTPLVSTEVIYKKGMVSFTLIFFLKGEINEDHFGSISVHLNQTILGYFIFTVYKLSCLKWSVISYLLHPAVRAAVLNNRKLWNFSWFSLVLPRHLAESLVPVPARLLESLSLGYFLCAASGKGGFCCRNY